MADKMAMKMGQRILKKKLAGTSDTSKRAKKDNSNAYKYKDGNHMRKKDAEYFHALGVPKKDAIKAAQVLHRARWLDGFKFGPLRIGPAIAIGAFPVVGSFADSILALLVVGTARSISRGPDGHGLDDFVAAKMLLNVGLGCLIGLIPVLGDLADSLFQVNSRNVRLLEEMLLKRVEEGKYDKWAAQKEAERSGVAPIRNHAPTGRSHPPTTMQRNSAPAPIKAPKEDAQYHNMHERLQAISARDPARKTQASRSGPGWFGKSKHQGENVNGGAAVPDRPTRPGNTIKLGGIARDDVLPPQRSRHVNGGYF